MKINKDGRFPLVERNICEPETALTDVEISASDRGFLAENLPNILGDDLPFTPVTLDVNGTVAVRAQGQDASNRMELALTGTTCRGEPTAWWSTGPTWPGPRGWVSSGSVCSVTSSRSWPLMIPGVT